ncbi:MAG: amidase [Parasphingorhabdus sp.]|jgi:amidase
MSEIIGWSAISTAENIRQRRVSCREVIDAHLEQIGEVNPAINAVVENHSEQAIELAKQQDNNWKAEDLPLLYGVPVTTKINVDQSGSCNSNGLPALNINPASQDSPVVTNLRNAGANIIGRTSTPEFSIRWFTSNPIYGVSKNPWQPDLTPGGSSGAAAAAVVSGIGCIAHGNDLGGSLRYPAYCCGAATIRPSFGRVPARNPSGAERPAITQSMSVNGPIARSVADVRLGLDSMAARSSNDPLWVNATNSGRDRKRPWKIAWFVDAFEEGCDTDVAAAVHLSVAALKDAGHQVEEVTPPHAMETATLWGTLLFAETTNMASDAIREMGSAELVTVFEAYTAFYEKLDLDGFLKAMQRRIAIQRVWNQMFDQYDAFILPVSGQKPFLNDFDFKFPERIDELLRAQRYLGLVNVLALPSAAVPVTICDGIPLGVQLVSAMHDDNLCLDIAEDLERVVGFSYRDLDSSWPLMESLRQAT